MITTIKYIIEKVIERHEYTCDGCGKPLTPIYEQSGDNTNSCTIKFKSGYNWGNEAISTTIESVSFCRECSKKIREFVVNNGYTFLERKIEL